MRTYSHAGCNNSRSKEDGQGKTLQIDRERNGWVQHASTRKLVTFYKVAAELPDRFMRNNLKSRFAINFLIACSH